MGNMYITVQARTGSTRFPNKILQDILPHVSVLEYLINRLKPITESKKWHAEIFVLTTYNPNDDIICNMAERLGVKYFRGDEQDVFQRMLAFAKSRLNTQDVIIDITSDCPLVPVNLITLCYGLVAEGKFDYCSNIAPRTYIDGFDVQAYKAWALGMIEKELIYSRESGHESLYDTHVYKQHSGWNILNLSGYLGIRCGNLGAGKKYTRPELALTLDTEEDLKVIKEVAEFAGYKNYGVAQIMDFVENNIEIFEYNKKVVRKSPGDS